MLPVFLLVASLVTVEGWRKGPCLGYDVLCTTADYQFRRYNPSVWVGIQASHGQDKTLDTIPLFGYFKGENSEEMRIRHPGQFLMSLTGQKVLAKYVMLPENLWDNPPTATDPRVFITRFPTMDVFVRNIPGFRFSDEHDFNRTLTEQNVNVKHSTFFVSFCTGYTAEFPYLTAGSYGSLPLEDTIARHREINKDALVPVFASF